MKPEAPSSLHQTSPMKKGITKLYYSIGEVAEVLGLEAHVLRFWETEFPELRPRKNRAGRRVYTADDIRVIERIQQLLRDDRYTIEGARHVLQLEGEGPSLEQRRASLQSLRTLLVQLRGEPDEIAPGAPSSE